MGMVIVGNKAFDLANVILLELREPHGDDRHPYVAATLHNGQTIEVTSPLTPNDRTAQCVMSSLVQLLADTSTTPAVVATVHDVAEIVDGGGDSEPGYITLKTGARYGLIRPGPGYGVQIGDMWKVDPAKSVTPAAAILRPSPTGMAHIVAVVTP